MWTKLGRLTVHKIVTRQIAPDHLKVHLAKAFTGTADEDMTTADLTECDFPGYAEIIDPAWDVPVINGSDQAEGKSSLLTWTAASIVTPQTIVAVYVCSWLTGTFDYLMWIKKISPTVTLGTPGEVFQRYVDLFVDDITALD